MRKTEQFIETMIEILGDEIQIMKDDVKEFVKFNELEGALHALKSMGQIDISKAKYKRMLELDVLPDNVFTDEHGEFVHISILEGEG